MSMTQNNLRDATGGYFAALAFWAFVTFFGGIAVVLMGRIQTDVLQYLGAWALGVICGTVVLAAVAFWWLLYREVAI